MKKQQKHSFHILTPALLVLLGWFASTSGSAQSKSAVGQAPAVPSAYVGANTCKTCHEQQVNNIQNTRHWTSLSKGPQGEAVHSCETCHGPGAAHVEGGGDKTKIFSFKGATPQAINERCLQCHSTTRELTNFSRSAHVNAGESCITCHSPHAAIERRSLLKQKQTDLCYSCHTVTQAQFSQPFRHRVNEGLMKCSDCHNPHGTPQPHMLRTTASQEAICFQCHREVQGPFMFEHVPVKTEGCQSCHQPHGSVNPRLLTVSQVNILCLQCHTPGTTTNTRQGGTNAPGMPGTVTHNQNTKFQSCTQCHVFIHGSNADETFMK